MPSRIAQRLIRPWWIEQRLDESLAFLSIEHRMLVAVYCLLGRELSTSNHKIGHRSALERSCPLQQLLLLVGNARFEPFLSSGCRCCHGPSY